MARRLSTDLGDEIAKDANLRVILALADGRAGETERAALAALLRSEHPLQPQLRDLLAAMIMGEHPAVGLVLKRTKRGPKGDGLLKQTQKLGKLLRIGRFIASHPDVGVRVENAVDAAVDDPGLDTTHTEAWAAWSAWKEMEEEFARPSERSFEN